MRTIYSGEPVTVIVEASPDVIHEQSLNEFAGEHYDRIHNVISIDDDGRKVTITTSRSLDALKRGEPNAGRGVWAFEHSMLERIAIEGKVVWGRAATIC